MSDFSLNYPGFLLRMQHLMTRFLKFSGGRTPRPPKSCSLIGLHFYLPCHHAGRVCHLRLDFMSQPLHLGFCTLVSSTHDCCTHFSADFSATWTSLGASGTPTPWPLFWVCCVWWPWPARGLAHFSGFFPKVHFDPWESHVKIMRQMCHIGVRITCLWYTF